ncbi:MAG: prenyltransferase/squalene oxidase repeat-containing protein, partial [bacterium]
MKKIRRLVLTTIPMILLKGSIAFAGQGELAIQKGVEWLVLNQNPSGSWGTETEYPNLCLRDTSLVADTLCYFGTTNTKAIQWISSQETPSSRAIARKIKILADYGSDTAELIGTLTSSQNEDGGFGVDRG